VGEPRGFGRGKLKPPQGARARRRIRIGLLPLPLPWRRGRRCPGPAAARAPGGHRCRLRERNRTGLRRRWRWTTGHAGLLRPDCTPRAVRRRSGIMPSVSVSPPSPMDPEPDAGRQPAAALDRHRAPRGVLPAPSACRRTPSLTSSAVCPCPPSRGETEAGGQSKIHHAHDHAFILFVSSPLLFTTPSTPRIQKNKCELNLFKVEIPAEHPPHLVVTSKT